MSKTLYILSGIPGSGKSTWARKKTAESETAIHISRDDIRFSLLDDNEPYFAQENSVIHMFINSIRDAIKKEYESIYIDATHLNDYRRKELIDKINDIKNYEIMVVIFNTSLETCLERNARRTGRARVPELTVKNMYKALKKYSNIYDYMILNEEEI